MPKRKQYQSQCLNQQYLRLPLRPLLIPELRGLYVEARDSAVNQYLQLLKLCLYQMDLVRKVRAGTVGEVELGAIAELGVAAEAEGQPVEERLALAPDEAILLTKPGLQMGREMLLSSQHLMSWWVELYC